LLLPISYDETLRVCAARRHRGGDRGVSVTIERGDWQRDTQPKICLK
jgi:hypothetical protein